MHTCLWWCWKDEALKARFMADPKAVLAEYDMPVPAGTPRPPGTWTCRMMS